MTPSAFHGAIRVMGRRLTAAFRSGRYGLISTVGFAPKIRGAGSGGWRGWLLHEDFAGIFSLPCRTRIIVRQSGRFWSMISEILLMLWS